jgi:hypothetical protein
MLARRALRTRRHLDRSPRSVLPDGSPIPFPSNGAHGDRIVFPHRPWAAQRLRRDPRMALSIAPLARSPRCRIFTLSCAPSRSTNQWPPRRRTRRTTRPARLRGRSRRLRPATRRRRHPPRDLGQRAQRGLARRASSSPTTLPEPGAPRDTSTDIACPRDGFVTTGPIRDRGSMSPIESPENQTEPHKPHESASAST